MTVSLEDAVLILLSVALVGANIVWIAFVMQPLSQWLYISEAVVQLGGTFLISMVAFCALLKVPRNWYRIVVYQAKVQR